MNKPQSNQKPVSDFSFADRLQTIIKRRRRSVILIIAIFLLLLILFNVGNFIFLHQMATNLEHELDIRLLSVVKLAATIVENEYPESFTANIDQDLTLQVIQDRLRTIRTQHQLEGLYIIDRNYQTILDSYHWQELQFSRTYLLEDTTWIEQTWNGIPVSSPIHTIEGQKFKSAYAPIHNLNGTVIGVLVAEANAYFFNLLDRYRNNFFATAAISAGAFVLFTAFLVYALRLLIQTQENLYKTERLAMMGQMAAILAHEIRNPLGIIRGTSDVLRNRYQQPEAPDPLFQFIPDEVNRLNKLVNNFLVLSRDAELSLEKQDINQLIEQTIAKIGFDEEPNKVQIIFHPASSEPFYFDRDGIEQVLINLIRNAIQAVSVNGVIDIRTNIVQKKKRNYVEIAIQDNGLGIDGEVHQLFEPFYTTKSKGSGLGLPVSQKILEKHGGWIEMQSQKDNGTLVTILIPFRLTNESKE